MIENLCKLISSSTYTNCDNSLFNTFFIYMPMCLCSCKPNEIDIINSWAHVSSILIIKELFSWKFLLKTIQGSKWPEKTKNWQLYHQAFFYINLTFKLNISRTHLYYNLSSHIPNVLNRLPVFTFLYLFISTSILTLFCCKNWILNI